MRIQNCSNTPSLKHDDRLTNSVICSPKRKRPNALKHGFYSGSPLIPGEDPDEFNDLYAELIDEWKPSGPTLRDGVFELADLRWKQRRLRRFMQTKLSSTTFDPRNPAFDEAWGFIMFIGCLRSEPETCFEQRASKYLLSDKINYLKRKFPRANYQSASEWAEAVINEIYFVLSPGIAGDKGEKACETAEEIDADLRDNFKEASRQWRADCRVTLGIMHASELLEYELKQGELLEERIRRKIKSLFELKTMEQMMLGKS